MYHHQRTRRRISDKGPAVSVAALVEQSVARRLHRSLFTERVLGRVVNNWVSAHQPKRGVRVRLPDGDLGKRDCDQPVPKRKDTRFLNVIQIAPRYTHDKVNQIPVAFTFQAERLLRTGNYTEAAASLNRPELEESAHLIYINRAQVCS